MTSGTPGAKGLGEKLHELGRNKVGWAWAGLPVLLVVVIRGSGVPLITAIVFGLVAVGMASVAALGVLAARLFFKRYPAAEVWLTWLVVGVFVLIALGELWRETSTPVKAMLLVVGLYGLLIVVGLLVLYLAVRVVRAAWGKSVKESVDEQLKKANDEVLVLEALLRHQEEIKALRKEVEHLRGDPP